MPRTSVVEFPGCPPIRVLTFDVLGLVKGDDTCCLSHTHTYIYISGYVSWVDIIFLCVVVEARGNEGGVAKVVERWGEPDSSKCVLAASINDRVFDPVWKIALFLCLC